ncbi:RNA-guided endonuclease InsQ/TnpB family protein [Actinacidiphila glaucinigra]|uniref:RNA-guided endonuclease InsQ/TnpB family protein n=1 Tax=Actinacidiphila glaucinigra TaxID=235986 RepID=UPI003D8F3DBF
MLIVVCVKLKPTAQDAAALRATLRQCNAAADYVSRVAFEEKEFSKFRLQQIVYTELKARGLGAQAAIRTIKKVCDAYVTLHANMRAGHLGKPGSERRNRAERKPVSFRPDAAQAYDDRLLSWQHTAGTVSIWTVHGRLKGVPFVGSDEQMRLVEKSRRGESDLVERDGSFYLLATCEVAESHLKETSVGFLGVDLGVVNIATTSKGEVFAGRALNRYRTRQERLRAKLLRKGTKSAKRLLKKRARKERRFAANVNHIISKRIVAEAERTSHGIALEDLQRIRSRARLRKPQRATVNSWIFAQLGQFLEYKARRSGVPLVYVDFTDTRRICSRCHHRNRGNLVSETWFHCTSCSVVAHADLNASRNIAHRGELAWSAGRESRAPATSPQAGGSDAGVAKQPAAPYPQDQPCRAASSDTQLSTVT